MVEVLESGGFVKQSGLNMVTLLLTCSSKMLFLIKKDPDAILKMNFVLGICGFNVDKRL